MGYNISVQLNLTDSGWPSTTGLLCARLIIHLQTILSTGHRQQLHIIHIYRYIFIKPQQSRFPFLMYSTRLTDVVSFDSAEHAECLNQPAAVLYQAVQVGTGTKLNGKRVQNMHNLGSSNNSITSSLEGQRLTDSKFFMAITKQVYPMSQSHSRRMYFTGCISTVPPNNMK